LRSSIQRSNATRKTAIPASAVRLAAGYLTPRRRNAAASAPASDASLISSRSWSSGFAAMMAWRRREPSRRCSKIVRAARAQHPKRSGGSWATSTP
jgi:hypothetical protein